jgi:hypothetical protein
MPAAGLAVTLRDPAAAGYRRFRLGQRHLFV